MIIRSKKIFPAIIAVLLFFACLFSVAFLTDFPVIAKEKKGKEQRAVIALRDNVSSFEKFGSRLFTLPYLKQNYSGVVYITERNNSSRTFFIRSLDSLLSCYGKVDIFFLAHSNFYYNWVQAIDSVKREHIRFVYNTGCADAVQADTWLKLGAKSYVAHAHQRSFSPVFYFYFLRRWAAGYDLKTAITESNESMISKFSRLNDILCGMLDEQNTIVSASSAECFGNDKLTVNSH